MNKVETSRFGITFMEDGEFLAISTNSARSYIDGFVSIAPIDNETVVATPPAPIAEMVGDADYDSVQQERIWSRALSPRGSFKILAPYSDRLSDWQIQFNGLPRMFDRLKFDVMEDLFGESVVALVLEYERHYGPRRESFGDLLAKAMQEGPLTKDDALGMYTHGHVDWEEDVNGTTRAARLEVLKAAQVQGDNLVVDRSLLIG